MFEGYMDIHYFEYENTTNAEQTVIFENLGKYYVEIKFEKSGFGSNFLILSPGRVEELKMKPGINKLVIYDSGYSKNHDNLEIPLKVTIKE